PADVFASANTSLPAQLHAKGLCSKPVVFARNTLVIVVPRSNPAGIRNIYDLGKSGVKVDIAAPGVPVGGYTLEVLEKLKLSKPVLANVVSRETDVREVLAKVALGEADAGFVYSTDARTTPGRVQVLKVPARAQPRLQYGICLVSSRPRRSSGRPPRSAHGRVGVRRVSLSGVPRVADRRDLRAHVARPPDRPAVEPRRRRRVRRQPEDERDRAAARAAARDADRLPAREPSFSGPLARRDPRRASARATSRGR